MIIVEERIRAMARSGLMSILVGFDVRVRMRVRG